MRSRHCRPLGLQLGSRDRGDFSIAAASRAAGGPLTTPFGRRQHGRGRSSLTAIQRGGVRLHEKAGKRHVPAYHRAAEVLDDYFEAAGLDEAPLFQSVDPAGRRPTGRGAVAASRSGYDQAAGGQP